MNIITARSQHRQIFTCIGITRHILLAICMLGLIGVATAQSSLDSHLKAKEKQRRLLAAEKANYQHLAAEVASLKRSNASPQELNRAITKANAAAATANLVASDEYYLRLHNQYENNKRQVAASRIATQHLRAPRVVSVKPPYTMPIRVKRRPQRSQETSMLKGGDIPQPTKPKKTPRYESHQQSNGNTLNSVTTYN